LFNGRLELIQTSGPRQYSAVNNKGRGAGKTHLSYLFNVLADGGSTRIRIKTSSETIYIQAKVCGITLQTSGRELPGPLEKQIVVFPKFPLLSSAYGSLGGLEGMLVVGQGEMLVDQPDVIAIAGEELL